MPLQASHFIKGSRFLPNHAVPLAECAPNTFTIRTVLIERQRVPFAPFGTEEVAAIDVDGAGEPIDRVENGMNDIGAQGLS